MNIPLASQVPRRHRTARQTELFSQLVELVLREGFADLTIEAAASRLRCSKSTIYSLASSREQLVRSAVISFFKAAAERVEAKLKGETDPANRLAVYLRAVGDELRPASPAFINDVAEFPPAYEIYERNTRIAGEKVRELVSEGVENGIFRQVPADFVSDVVASVMVRIQQRQVSASTGLSDAEAYEALAHLIVDGIRIN